MKRGLLTIALLIAVPALAFAAGAESALEGRILYRMQVEGLVCPFCAYNVEQKLQAVSGVEYVDVDVESGRVMVGVGPDHNLAQARVRALIEEAGFQFKGMERRPMTRKELKRPE